MRCQPRRPAIERSHRCRVRRTKSRDFFRILRVDQMIEPSVLQLRSIRRTRFQSPIRQKIAGIHGVDCRLSLAAEMFSEISRDLFSSETHLVDPSLVWREKYEVCRERDCSSRLEALNDTTEIMNEKLLPQPGDGLIVLAGGMKSVWVIAGSTEAAEDRIDTRPSPFEMTDVHVDNRICFRVERIIHIDEYFSARFDDDNTVLAGRSDECDACIAIDPICFARTGLRNFAESKGSEPRDRFRIPIKRIKNSLGRAAQPAQSRLMKVIFVRV